MNINRSLLNDLITAGSLSPQATAIARHLQTVGSISGVEAAALYKCRHLPRRIKDIKEKGVMIETQRKVDATGQKYGRYVVL